MKRVIREKIFPVGLFITVLTGLFYLWGTAYAHADGTVDDKEVIYANIYAPVICSYLDDKDNRTNTGVVKLGAWLISKTEVQADSAVDILNYAVSTQCPRNWSLLTSVGDYYRAQQKGKVV